MNLTLCNEFNVKFPTLPIMKRKKKQINEVLNSLISLIDDPNFDNDFIHLHTLNKIVQLTKSEYGFIGKYYEDSLHSLALSNIAWNSASKQFYKEHIDSPMVFALHDNLYDKNEEITIYNDYSKLNRSVLPKGHPPINRFAYIPIRAKGKIVGCIGLCNRLTPYKRKQLVQLDPILKFIALNINE